MKEKITQSRGLLVGMGGYFAGMLTSWLCHLPTLQKAGLVVIIGGIACFVLLVISPKPSS